MSYRAAVGLGSNLGDRLETLRSALSGLRELGEIEAVSSLYETAPVGGPTQGPYLNAVAVLSTPLAPSDLLSELLRAEAQAGRVRRERWGPRSLDLDLIAATDGDGRWVRVETDELQIPHPRAHLRRFVVAPLVEVWPDARLEGDAPAADSLEELMDQEVEVLGTGWTVRKTGAARAFVGVQLLLLGGYGIGLVLTGRRPERLDFLTLSGGAATVVGAGLALWASTSLGPALSPYPEPLPGTELVVAGPYRFVRHPIYSGLVLSLAGVGAVARSWPAAVGTVTMGAFFSAKARYEESRLRLAVPGYAGYMRRVQGRLIPGPTALLESWDRATLTRDGDSRSS